MIAQVIGGLGIVMSGNGFDGGGNGGGEVAFAFALAVILLAVFALILS